ncbi:hypothetical protein ACSFBX_10050 [Variovorax sp. RB2P76]|uniref:hypothetical protein n=1 Tax=Variovorax sp. RB2P76 TaxID=3443736 RepID=UPI003F47ED44
MKSPTMLSAGSPPPPAATRFRPGAPSANPTGRPTKLALARRGLQPLAHLGVLEGELQALAEAQAAGNARCWDAAMALIGGRLRLDPRALAQAAQPAGAALAQTGGRNA